MTLHIRAYHTTGKSEEISLRDMTRAHANRMVTFMSRYLSSANNPEDWQRVQIVVEEDTTRATL